MQWTVVTTPIPERTVNGRQDASRRSASKDPPRTQIWQELVVPWGIPVAVPITTSWGLIALFQQFGVRSWLFLARLKAAQGQALARLRDDRGDLSAYLAQGVLALAAVSLTGVVLGVFSTVGTHLKDIVNSWLNVPITTG